MLKNSKKDIPVTGRPLFYWAFVGNARIQISLLLLIFAIVFFRVIPLEMQKRIINESIVLRQFDSLLLYCGIYLLAVTATGLIKLAVNYIQARIAEQAILSMRQDLYAHIISLPLHFFRNSQPGMVVSSLMTELNTAGTFAGMALAVPVSNILTLFAFALYLLWLNPKLALATLGIYPVVVFLIPYLQKKTNRLNKKRVDQSRLVASQIAESVTGVTEINVHGAYGQEKQKFNTLVEGLKVIRVKWSLLRFGVKTVNNYFVSLGPFVVFLFGGYLVMNGQLELGSMVAFLSAQEKLYDPWKELIEYYQVYQDASVRYKRVMGYFDMPGGYLPPAFPEAMQRMGGTLQITNLSYTTANGVQLLKNINLSVEAGKHLALVGFSGSGKSTLVHCIAKMFDYSSGSLLIDGCELKEISKGSVVHNVGYISQQPFIFSGTIRENLLYAHQAAFVISSVTSEKYCPPVRDRLILALQHAGLFVDVIRFGLNTVLHSKDSEMMMKIIRIRAQFRLNYGETLAEYIEFNQTENYLDHSSVAENIIFSTSVVESFSFLSLADNGLFIAFLDRMQITDDLLLLGVKLLRKSMDLFSYSPEEKAICNSGLIDENERSQFQIILNHLEHSTVGNLLDEEKKSLFGLALRFTPGIHTIFVPAVEFKQKVLQCRQALDSDRDKIFPGIFHPLRKDEYIFGQSIWNNIFYGRLKTDDSQIQDKISQDIIRLLIEEDCLEAIAEAGMEYHLGSMGNRLSGGQKQKLAIARVLLKDPQIILMDESTSALDNKSQARIQRLIDTRWKGKKTVVAVVHRLDSIKGFDAIGVMKDGKLEEIGGYDELLAREGLFYSLVHGKKKT